MHREDTRGEGLREQRPTHQDGPRDEDLHIEQSQ